MKARTAELARIQAPIKKQISHLDGRSQQNFPELLKELVSKLRKNEYKLVHVTKSYRKKGTVQSDSFWKKSARIRGIKVVWFCTLTTIFDKGFKFNLDFDFWFEFSKLLQNLRGELYERGFPYTSRSYAEDFGRKEATRVLNKVEEAVKRKMKHKVGGWGEHGISKDVTDRKSRGICHRKIISISSLSELDKLRESLREISEEPIEVVEESSEEVHDLARKKLDELIPLSIKPNSSEGFLNFFLWFRKPGGGFEYQVYRFIQENYGKLVDKHDIRDALLRSEVHGYIKVEKTPKNLRRDMEGWGIRRCRRFYEAEEDLPGQKLSSALKNKVRTGAYLSPLPRKRLIKQIDAPNHLTNKAIRKLVRKNYLIKRRIKDFLGRTIRKIKPKRSSRGLSGLEKRIIDKSWKFYNIQKNALDQLQEARP